MRKTGIWIRVFSGYQEDRENYSDSNSSNNSLFLYNSKALFFILNLFTCFNCLKKSSSVCWMPSQYILVEKIFLSLMVLPETVMLLPKALHPPLPPALFFCSLNL